MMRSNDSKRGLLKPISTMLVKVLIDLFAFIIVQAGK